MVWGECKLWVGCYAKDYTTLLQFFFFPAAVPALRPLVHDLFVLRGSSKSDANKELDTQREVVVSMLLRLIYYYEVNNQSVD